MWATHSSTYTLQQERQKLLLQLKATRFSSRQCGHRYVVEPASTVPQPSILSMTACTWRSWYRGWPCWKVPQWSRKICLKVSLSTRCMVVAIEHVCTTSSHPDPSGYAPSSDPLYPSSPPGGTGRRGDSQKGNSYTLHIAPCGRTIRLARRTPWYPHYIRNIPPWA